MNDVQKRKLRKMAETLDAMQCAWQNKDADQLHRLTEQLMAQQEMIEMDGKTILDLSTQYLAEPKVTPATRASIEARRRLLITEIENQLKPVKTSNTSFRYLHASNAPSTI